MQCVANWFKSHPRISFLNIFVTHSINRCWNFEAFLSQIVCFASSHICLLFCIFFRFPPRNQGLELSTSSWHVHPRNTYLKPYLKNQIILIKKTKKKKSGESNWSNIFIYWNEWKCKYSDPKSFQCTCRRGLCCKWYNVLNMGTVQ